LSPALANRESIRISSVGSAASAVEILRATRRPCFLSSAS
jgi:hypothetical protein